MLIVSIEEAVQSNIDVTRVNGQETSWTSAIVNGASPTGEHDYLVLWSSSCARAAYFSISAMTEGRQSLIRRNGKPQSCEPCRKSKIKCDHALPTCGRCIQRKIQHRCEYHPAPMTQQERPIRALSSIGSEPSEWIGPNLHAHLPTSDAAKVDGKQPAGYLGPTSISAMFRENELDGTTEDFAHRTAESIFQEYDIAKPSSSEPCDLEAQGHVDQGVRVLKRFPDRLLCDRLLERYFDVCDVLIPEPVIQHVHKSIWSTYEEHLSPSGKTNGKGLSAMSKELCRTAMTPLGPSSNTRGWLESYSGKNLRWEILGNLFALFGLAFMTILDWDPLFTSSNDKKAYNKRQFSGEMRECAEACLALCNHVDAVNDFVVSLMFNAYSLQSFYEGDVSKFDGKYRNVTVYAFTKTY